ncbi:MAG: xanthine dehydrogenase family protein molybdopterin-binding subunit [Acidobacteria bacterium]|nr:xanthine dehydrogenase family protein molybdopterin-binding subunit [Acidobacteriota bacterium]
MARKIIKSKYFVEEDFVEVLAEVPAGGSSPLPTNQEMKVIGRPVTRLDGYDKVSGTARYTFDINLPHLAHARTLRSPYAHARITAIDAREAAKMPGVLGIIHYQNVDQIPWYGSSFLFDPHLRYVGDEVACVAAETEAAASAALKRIKVEYEELPFVVDAAAAMKQNAPAIHEGGNIQGGKPAVYARGDFDAGLAEADVVVEETFTTQVEVHNPTEVHCSVVNWEGDRLTVWDSTQAIFSVRDTVAQSLGLPASQVRVIKRYMGGGFGSKLTTGKYTVMAALLAQRIGRPVRITLDREEMNLAVGNRPDSVQKLTVAAKKDGTLSAMSHWSYGAVGAYPSGAACSWPLRTIYQCPNVKTEEYSVFINAGPGRPFRAPGHVQGTFALESILDDVAEKLAMDPLEFRRKNHATIDQVMNLPYTSKKLLEAYDAGAKAIGWDRRRKVPGADKGRYQRGLGFASQIWWGAGTPPAGCILKLNRDGSVRLIAGTQDIGTGTYTVMAQVAAEILEIPIERIQVNLGDTAVGPYCPLSGGSLTTPSVTPAVADAALQMKEKLLSAAAAILEVPQGELVYQRGEVRHTGDTSKKKTIVEILREMREQTLLTYGARNANPEGYAINSFGAQFAEVEVDTLTGHVKVIKVVAAHDIGRAVNRLTLENQFHGGILQGIGFALMEERVIDPQTGKVLTVNLHDYKMPTIMDMPEIEVIIVSEADTKISNVGAKGVGEPAMIPTPGAIANAIYNAIGVRLHSLPMTPDKILMALAQKG